MVAGGVWASFQRHLGRMVGYRVMTEIGYSLLAVSCQEGSDLLYDAVATRFGFAV
jgi:formate hydrogenlyase subunit 3/multisubunit Na+/H+ antiporter MnhD subunit